MNRSRVLAKLADWTRLPTGSADAVDQLRQHLQAFGIELKDRRALRLAERALSIAEDLHSGIGDEPEYVKRARVNYALARLCELIEGTMADEVIVQSTPGATRTRDTP
jgi:hypothetical protein